MDKGVVYEALSKRDDYGILFNKLRDGTLHCVVRDGKAFKAVHELECVLYEALKRELAYGGESVTFLSRCLAICWGAYGDKAEVLEAIAGSENPCCEMAYMLAHDGVGIGAIAINFTSQDGARCNSAFGMTCDVVELMQMLCDVFSACSTTKVTISYDVLPTHDHMVTDDKEGAVLYGFLSDVADHLRSSFEVEERAGTSIFRSGWVCEPLREEIAGVYDKWSVRLCDVFRHEMDHWPCEELGLKWFLTDICCLLAKDLFLCDRYARVMCDLPSIDVYGEEYGLCSLEVRIATWLQNVPITNLCNELLVDYCDAVDCDADDLWSSFDKFGFNSDSVKAVMNMIHLPIINRYLTVTVGGNELEYKDR